MEPNKELLHRAESMLRCFGISDLPIRLGDSHFFVAKVTDANFTEVGTFSFAGRTFKVGESKKEKE